MFTNDCWLHWKIINKKINDSSAVFWWWSRQYTSHTWNAIYCSARDEKLCFSFKLSTYNGIHKRWNEVVTFLAFWVRIRCSAFRWVEYHNLLEFLHTFCYGGRVRHVDNLVMEVAQCLSYTVSNRSTYTGYCWVFPTFSFSSRGFTDQIEPRPPRFEVFGSHTHRQTDRHRHTHGRKCDTLFAEAATYTTHNSTKDEHPLHQLGSNLRYLQIKRPDTDDLYRTAIGIPTVWRALNFIIMRWLLFLSFPCVIADVTFS